VPALRGRASIFARLDLARRLSQAAGGHDVARLGVQVDLEPARVVRRPGGRREGEPVEPERPRTADEDRLVEELARRLAEQALREPLGPLEELEARQPRAERGVRRVALGLDEGHDVAARPLEPQVELQPAVGRAPEEVEGAVHREDVERRRRQVGPRRAGSGGEEGPGPGQDLVRVEEPGGRSCRGGGRGGQDERQGQPQRRGEVREAGRGVSHGRPLRERRATPARGDVRRPPAPAHEDGATDRLARRRLVCRLRGRRWAGRARRPHVQPACPLALQPG